VWEGVLATDRILVDVGRNGHVSTRGAPVGEIASVDVAVLVVRRDFGLRQSDGSGSSGGASTRAFRRRRPLWSCRRVM
jgi:hypothetical protein